MKALIKTLVFAILIIAGQRGWAQSASLNKGADPLNMSVTGRNAQFDPASSCNVNLTTQGASCNLTPDGSVSVDIYNPGLSYPFQYSFTGTTYTGSTYGPVTGSSSSPTLSFSALLPGTYWISFNSNAQICPYGAGADTVVVGIGSSPVTVSPHITSVSCSGSNQFNFVMTGATPPLSYTYYDNINGTQTGSIDGNEVQITNAPSADDYTISGTGSLGCPFSGSVHITGAQPYQNQTICIVSVDSSTNKNNVVWEQSQAPNISHYNIYKQNSVTSQNDNIASVNVDSLSVFIDVNSNPAQQSSTYFISVVDSCGQESGISAGHTTIHLSANLGVNSEVNLQWNPYVGFSYTDFEIYRSNNGSGFSLIGTVSNTSYAYTDLTPPSGTNYYYVSVVNPAGCNPSRSISSSSSNILSSVALSVADVGPQPLSVIRGNQNGTFTLNLPADGNLMVYDNLGQRIYQSKTIQGLNTLDLTPHAAGIYFVQFQTNDKLYSAKIVSE